MVSLYGVLFRLIFAINEITQVGAKLAHCGRWIICLQVYIKQAYLLRIGERLFQCVIKFPRLWTDSNKICSSAFLIVDSKLFILW